MSLMVLCLIDVKPPRLQISEWSCVFSSPHMHVFDLPSIGKLYLMATASLNSCLFNEKPYSSSGRDDSHDDAPFSHANATNLASFGDR